MIPACDSLVHFSHMYVSAPQSLHHTFALHLHTTQATPLGNPILDIIAGTSFGLISAHASAARSFLSLWDSLVRGGNSGSPDKGSCISSGRGSCPELESAVVSAIEAVELRDAAGVGAGVLAQG